MTALVRRPHYEEVLNAAIKDENSQHGIISVPMQRFATQAINNPLFQRVQATLENKLETEQRQVLEQRGFQDNLTRISVEAKVPREDLKWLVENLNPPPPPMPPPPPPSEAKIDYARISAEMDAVMQRRAVEESRRAMAEKVKADLQAQSMATPAQQIIKEHHHHHFTVQPPPVPAVPTTITAQAHHTGKSFHEKFIEPSSSSTDIPVQYQRNQPSMGYPISSAEFPDELMRPQVIPTGSVKQLKTKFEKKDTKPKQPVRPATTTAPMATPAGGFSSTSRPPAALMTPGIQASIFPPRQAPPPTNVEPISGQMRLAIPTRQPDIRAVAQKRIIEIAERARQDSTRAQSFAKLVENEKRRRRGGAMGDVAPLGKRKEREPDIPLSMLRKPAGPAAKNSKQRIYGPRTEVFNMGEA
jgi:hypothetical protein